MLQVHDIRETRIYQELKEEVIQQERQRSLEEKLRTIPKLAARNMSAADIAEILELDLELVNRELARSQT